ncbi:2-C-methyl-D-erythritol 2,4-cyclodiphosphate synthase [Syntrophus aciditrophicus]|uniref:2-C-methyl-D-erythritol 2,4-cyclodiphosphate synthase n=1 Tax=Syntrophus aciditrophicus (strain SB) TaxID=56780 RepID=ISPF_SYNAS|nr:2-C-methyl-D-erythritol 2,4-cyclodiphosphate synthase [Syntrophus aciditrophicus]Q2LUT1.1 RecName: Full=2-C-methyl-D-erythritol 2,4-cyclodiphosphate synthase; Short=MECDP-synthase; Short=MECPP-synthase; Short=MECPS [Syntrophus aciditrophicus SB]ABC77842.1 2-c-methyl-d-erythritol 2,4-cyclodiphosphate synthase [Syntrophus aciditrophicus SB]OPY18765.1 MAG: 2-C-methyl-D-erythritol 2,4-cyclodiphosphate synthase [Syntrophus sp. PtaB.Bin075]
MRVGCGYDSHRWAAKRKLILGGVEIPHEFGLTGHSDADALTHAICDALLGAISEGDIGFQFPDSDPAYSGISSLKLLSKILEMVDKKGFAIDYIDSTVIMERPKLMPYIPDMKSKIAGVLKMPSDRINIKAKTNEGMGFVGRQEGVAVFAVALVKENQD